VARRIRYKKHQVIGGWKLSYRLGKGGNGDVWSVKKGDDSRAIKLLKNIREPVYKRFLSEVSALLNNQDIDGVIPIIDSSLPDTIKRDIPWFVMPVASKFSQWREGKETLQIVEGMLELAKTLATLHEREVHHRDIKPANILYLNDRLYLSDFGLVKYPNRVDITPKGSDVGPKFTMAPEMRRYAQEADGESADIYSFAKTLWIAIVGDYKCFDGQYSPFSIISINNTCKGLYTKSLNDLLTECTDNSPTTRPRMNEVIARLEEWLKINNDFHDKNLTEWFDLQNRIFPAGSPDSVTWTKSNDILTILNEIAQVKSLNHTFLPGGGGNTFVGAEPANEQGLIAIKISEKMYDLVKPKKLTYESFGLDPQWNYFRLEAEEIATTGVYDKEDPLFPYEDLLEISPCHYVDRYHWDEGEYNGKCIPDEARLTCRYFKGSFVIFSTRSVYNLEPGTYDGRHNKMSENEFRDYISRSAQSASS